MQFYLLKESLMPCAFRDALPVEGTAECQFVAIVTPEEWTENHELFKMGIELDPGFGGIHSSKAEVNFDSLTGSFMIPDRANLPEGSFSFAFALDEKGIVLVDEGTKAAEMTEAIRSTKRWKRPCLERFLYDFLEEIVEKDLSLMESFEKELDTFEDQILAEKEHVDLARINTIRNCMRQLRVHYEQLIDMTQELEENENGFFKEKNLSYLHLFMNRILRLHDTAASVWDHTMQVRDLYHTQLEVRQNRIMTLLTVITTIFMPLTLIAGWYGMNFRHMPELEWTWSYPAVFLICLVIVVACLVFFRKKKWL
jgi:magnesium transporter